MENEKVVVASFSNELNAELARGRLASSGIESAIIKDDGGGMFPSMQGTETVQLMVTLSDEKQARRILDEKSAGQ